MELKIGDWVIIRDCDNVLYNDLIGKVWNINVVYFPDEGYHHLVGTSQQEWDNSSLRGLRRQFIRIEASKLFKLSYIGQLLYC